MKLRCPPMILGLVALTMIGCGAKSDLTRRAQFDPDRVLVRDDAGTPPEPPVDPLPDSPPAGPMAPAGAWTFDFATGAIRFMVLEVCEDDMVRLGFYDASFVTEFDGVVVSADEERFEVTWVLSGNLPEQRFPPTVYQRDGDNLLVVEPADEFPWAVIGPGVPGCAPGFPVENWTFTCQCTP